MVGPTDARKRISPDPIACSEYVRGRNHLDAGVETAEGFPRARAHLERAIARDPGFALAHEALAQMYWILGYIGSMRPGMPSPPAFCTPCGRSNSTTPAPKPARSSPIPQTARLQLDGHRTGTVGRTGAEPGVVAGQDALRRQLADAPGANRRGDRRTRARARVGPAVLSRAVLADGHDRAVAGLRSAHRTSPAADRAGTGRRRRPLAAHGRVARKRDARRGGGGSAEAVDLSGARPSWSVGWD